MDKRYQVFISSTYADLKEERRDVIQAVIELNCIPAGMELFPAADEAQLDFIKRVIDDCDYYLLIIGGRYGSVDESGISFTEREYDYAMSRKLKIIALIHGSPDDIPFGKSEQNPVLRERLRQFRDKVIQGRLVKLWKSGSELPGLVSRNLSHSMHEYPAVGWVSADRVANVEVLGEINQLRKQNSDLGAALANYKKMLADLSLRPSFKDLAELDEEVTLKGIFWRNYSASYVPWSVKTTWRKAFAYVSPYLIKHPNEEAVKTVLTSALFRDADHMEGIRESLDDQDFQTVGVQLRALGLVKIEYSESTTGSMGLFWSLTDAGERLMLELRTVPTTKLAAGDQGKP
jgi:hypothetical protein